MKEVIIFNCVDNFGKEYKIAMSCYESEEAEAVKWAMSKSTEIKEVSAIMPLAEF